MRHFAADHHLDDLVDAARALLEGLDLAAVAEDRGHIGQFLDLVHAVRHVENANAFLAQLADDEIDAFDVLCGQRRRGLVEDEQLGLLGQRLGDFHHLAARQRQVLDQFERMHVLAAHPLQQLHGARTLRLLVDEAAARRRAGHGKIVGNRHVGEQREFLEDADHPGPHGIGRRAEPEGRTIDQDFALAGVGHARGDLDERGFAGAVLAKNSVDLAGIGLEVDIRQRGDAAVALGDALEFEKRSAFSHGLGRKAA